MAKHFLDKYNYNQLVDISKHISTPEQHEKFLEKMGKKNKGEGVLDRRSVEERRKKHAQIFAKSAKSHALKNKKKEVAKKMKKPEYDPEGSMPVFVYKKDKKGRERYSHTENG